MSHATTCPGLEEFAKFLMGQLPQPGRAALAEHLEACPSCAETMRKLRGGAASADNGSAPGQAPRPPAGGGNQAPRAGDTLVSDAENPLLAPPQEPGEVGRLGPYRVLRILGTGGMGVVYAGEDVQLRRPVALKVMKPEYGNAEKARRRFLREARAMAALEHDNIVRIYQVGEERGLPYLAMQLLRGETLCDRLERDGKLTAREVARLGREAAAGLAAAHERGVIHRDIKPANLWIEEDTGRVKILDFGLARSADDTHLTQTGTLVGTPEYMSPEQARGKPLDPRTDLFSLGSVLYHAASGRLPFHAPETMGTLMAVINQTPTALTEYNRDLPEMLVVLIVRLLAKHPDDRPATAEAVAGAFHEVEQLLGCAPPSGDRQQPLRRPRRAPSSSARLFVVALLLSGLGFAAYWSGGDLLRALQRYAERAGVQLPKK